MKYTQQLQQFGLEISLQLMNSYYALIILKNYWYGAIQFCIVAPEPTR